MKSTPMRRIPRRSQRIVDKLRADARPRFRASLTPSDEQRREAAQALSLRTYVGKPVEVGAELARQLRTWSPGGRYEVARR